MRRNILLALIAALALAVGLSNVATADQGSADASAKSGKKGKRGKGKACKGKRGKGKRGKGKSRGKARRSADASAKARRGRRGKGKRRGCKGGAKNANWVKNGEYADSRSGIGVRILGRGKQVTVLIPAGIGRCAPAAIEIDADKTIVTASKLIAEWRTLDPSRGLHQSYRLTLLPNYSYKLLLDAGFAFPGQDPCLDPGVMVSGRLSA